MPKQKELPAWARNNPDVLVYMNQLPAYAEQVREAGSRLRVQHLLIQEAENAYMARMGASFCYSEERDSWFLSFAHDGKYSRTGDTPAYGRIYAFQKALKYLRALPKQL